MPRFRGLGLFYLFRFLATSYLWVPVLWFFMTSCGLGWGDIMILSAVYSGVVVCAEMPTGALADRIGRRRSMMLGALGMAVACAVAATVRTFVGFAVFEALAAVSMALCSGADSAYLFDLLAATGREEEYPRAEAVASACHQAGNVVAYLAGGLLGAIDLALPYVATAALAAAAFVVAFFLAEKPPARVASGESHGHRVRAWARHMGRAGG
ncbi:MAG TPA: MFS transporter, partial [Kofleriaceae bacterium]|nr:MFS transporter [Kofleriaceae bacterium]